MTYVRFVLAVIAATIADFGYGFVVYGNLLTSSFLAQTGIYRSAEAQMANMPIGAGGIVLAMMAATLLFASGGHRRGMADGAAFGLRLAMFVIGAVVIVNFATLNITAGHAAMMAVAALGEWLVVGVVIGAVYGLGRRG
jgi:hypothetical protein